MIGPILLLAAASATATNLGATTDKFELCVMTKTDQFSSAKEAADVTVRAATAACRLERADLRAALQKYLSADQSLSGASAKTVEQSTYDIILGGAYDRALVHLVTLRSNNAPNQ